MLAYEFHKSYLDGRLVLDKEIFREVKPGLSSFVDNPKEGANKIGQLLDEAKNFIPTHLWSNTPLVLKATAGRMSMKLLCLRSNSDGSVHSFAQVYVC